ncbi:MAG TPA: hypothetical protein VFG14_10760 [Chthoniobacteraceae bacterium]|nr:hypothetical protein [Chthoniobacteraceae bacterium]
MSLSDHSRTEGMSENVKLGARRGTFWLFLPWLALIFCIVAETTRFSSWFVGLFPRELSSTAYQLTSIAKHNVGWGLLFLTVGSSARWVYLRRENYVRVRSFDFWIMLVSETGILTVTHCAGFAGLLLIEILFL